MDAISSLVEQQRAERMELKDGWQSAVRGADDDD